MDAPRTALPADWMPDCDPARVIVHWTGGTHRANATDRAAYHVLIEGDGRAIRGDRSIADNCPRGRALMAGDRYAAHTRGLNTRSIGIAVCAMGGAVERPLNVGRWPITREQWGALIDAVAQLALRYGIRITPQTVLTHAEVEATIGVAQAGKWDITVLPFDPSAPTGAREVGDKMRRQVITATERIALAAAPTPPKAEPPTTTFEAPPAPERRSWLATLIEWIAGLFRR